LGEYLYLYGFLKNPRARDLVFEFLTVGEDGKGLVGYIVRENAFWFAAHWATRFLPSGTLTNVIFSIASGIEFSQ